MQVEQAGVELAALPAQRRLGVELDRHRRQAVVVGAPLEAAGGVGERLARFGDVERAADFGESLAQAAEIAEQVGAVIGRGIGERGAGEGRRHAGNKPAQGFAKVRHLAAQPLSSKVAVGPSPRAWRGAYGLSHKGAIRKMLPGVNLKCLQSWIYFKK